MNTCFEFHKDKADPILPDFFKTQRRNTNRKPKRRSAIWKKAKDLEDIMYNIFGQVQKSHANNISPTVTYTFQADGPFANKIAFSFKDP